MKTKRRPIDRCRDPLVSQLRTSVILALFLLAFLPIAVVSQESRRSDAVLEAPVGLKGKTLGDCTEQLEGYAGGWCEVVASEAHPSISSVWPQDLDRKIRMRTGPKSVLIAWNSAAYDRKRQVLYFLGGGHADYGGNEVYEFDLPLGQWKRLTDPSRLDYLAIMQDYSDRPAKPWRRLCWIPDVRAVPGSSHTYDGLIFSYKTDTLFFYSTGPANGSCFEDERDLYKDSPLVWGHLGAGAGWYEFNPSDKQERNGLGALQWRKVFDYEDLKSASIHQRYPVSVELPDGEIVFGSKFMTVAYDPRESRPVKLKRFTKQADWGDGLQVYDGKRGLIWSLHKNALLAFDVTTGQLVRTVKQRVEHGKSLAFGRDGKILSWDGRSRIFILDPDEQGARWKAINWGAKGPSKGDQRVYGKWRYIEDKDVFVGLSTHETGVWIYKHPYEMQPVSFSTQSLGKLVQNAQPGSVLEIPPGNYLEGLFVDKSLTIRMRDVHLGGVSHRKGVINVKCDDCRVIIEDFHTDGDESGCKTGNCAGIKAEGKNFSLTVRRAHIDGTVMGILTDNRGGELIIEDSLIENTGLDGRTNEVAHGLYAGLIDSLTVRNSTIRRPFGSGHVLKSRARQTRVENSVLAGMDGRHSRVVDYPCGGDLSILDSVLQQGEQTENTDLISVGTEPRHCGGSVKDSSVSITDSWIIVDRDRSPDERAAQHGNSRLFTWRAPVVSIDVSNNRIIDPTGELAFESEGNLPDMLDRNELYRDRKAAGLGPGEIPEM